jgi:hypothetical protein
VSNFIVLCQSLLFKARTCVNDRDWLFGHVDFLEINDLESVDAVQPIPKAHR